VTDSQFNYSFELCTVSLAKRDERQIGGACERLYTGKGKHYHVMIARLQLASHRAHWIEVTGNKETDKADFYKYLSDSMTSRSDQETILTQRLAQRF
jgi:hypothetical protein